MLEAGAAELPPRASRGATSTALRRLNDRVAAAPRPGRDADADRKFHHHIHELSGNELLVQLLDSIAELGKGVRREGIARDEIRVRSAEQHVAIIEAIASGEPAAAGAAMRRHLDYVQRVLQALEADEAGASGGDEPNGQAPGLA